MQKNHTNAQAKVQPSHISLITWKIHIAQRCPSPPVKLHIFPP